MSNLDRFLAAEEMSRAEELELLEDCILSEVALKCQIPGTGDPVLLDFALLVARFVHLVREKESQEDSDHWDATVGP